MATHSSILAWRIPWTEEPGGLQSIVLPRDMTEATQCVPRTHTFFFISLLCLPINCEGFPGGSVGKEYSCNAGDLGLIPGLGRYPGEGKGYPLQYSGLENSMDCIVHGVAKSRT